MVSFVIKYHYNINMAVSLKIFLDIITFSKGPQDLPASRGLMNAIIVLNLLVALISFMPQTIVAMNIANAIIFIIVTNLFIKTALTIRDSDSDGNNFSARYVQVCTSILGIHALFVLIQGTLIALFTNSDTISADAIPSDVAIIFLLVSLYAWFVNGHIFKNALDTSMIIGLGVSLLHGIAIIFVTLVLIQIFA